MLERRIGKGKLLKKGRAKGTAQRGALVTFGDFGIKALDAGWVTSRQIEAARIAMTRNMKRAGKVWIRIFPDKPITKKPAETRMGKGKGSPEYFVAVVKPGRILFEVGGVPEDVARESMRRAIQKLPIKCKVVVRPDFFHDTSSATQVEEERFYEDISEPLNAVAEILERQREGIQNMNDSIDDISTLISLEAARVSNSISAMHARDIYRSSLSIENMIRSYITKVNR